MVHKRSLQRQYLQYPPHQSEKPLFPHRERETKDVHKELRGHLHKMNIMMESEIAAAVSFLKGLIKLKNTVQEEKIVLFGEKLTTALQEKYKGHWYSDNPIKGQAYRCVRVNYRLGYDPELLRACTESGIEYSDLGLPWEMTLWVDPGEVCGRYGEENYSFPVATISKETGKIMWQYRSIWSDEEKTHSSGLNIPNGKCSTQTLNPKTPAWFPKHYVSGVSKPS